MSQIIDCPSVHAENPIDSEHYNEAFIAKMITCTLVISLYI